MADATDSKSDQIGLCRRVKVYLVARVAHRVAIFNSLRLFVGTMRPLLKKGRRMQKQKPHWQRIAAAITCAAGALSCFLTWYTIQGEAIAGARAGGRIPLALFAIAAITVAIGPKCEPLKAGQRIGVAGLVTGAGMIGAYRLADAYANGVGQMVGVGIYATIAAGVAAVVVSTWKTKKPAATTAAG